MNRVVNLLLLVVLHGEPVHATEETSASCGLGALYCLLRAEGKSCTLLDVAAVLPHQTAEGYSLLEIQEGARLLGLSLKGIQTSSANAAPRKRAMVYLSNREFGHFIVIEPVGKSGKLVQVIDPVGLTYVVAYAELKHRKDWTGKMLLVAPWDLASTQGAAIVMFCVSLAFFALWCRRAKPTSPRGAAPEANL